MLQYEAAPSATSRNLPTAFVPRISRRCSWIVLRSRAISQAEPPTVDKGALLSEIRQEIQAFSNVYRASTMCRWCTRQKCSRQGGGGWWSDNDRHDSSKRFRSRGGELRIACCAQQNSFVTGFTYDRGTFHDCYLFWRGSNGCRRHTER
jgi:hypothetical protein